MNNTAMNKIMRILFACIILLIGTQACNNTTTVYSKIKTISESYVWVNTDTIEFTPSINDTVNPMQISLMLRYILGYPHTFLPVQMWIIDPDGVSLQLKAKIRILDDENKYLGDIMGDLCDVEKVVLDSVFFVKPGEYRFRLLHDNVAPVTSHVSSIGIRIIKKSHVSN